MTEPAPRIEIDRVVEIERLAALAPLEYDIAREAAAKQIGTRIATLDKLVKKKRLELGLDKQDNADTGQGRTIQLSDVLPYHEHVEGAALATMLSCVLKNYVVIDDALADAVALWIMHTWLIDQFQVSPRLAVYSPTKGCGKTTLLSVVSKLVRRPMLAISISPAAVFRVVEMFQPTLIIDELKKFLETDGDMHGLLNAGHGRGMRVIRVLGEQLEPREFSVFGAVAVGTLGKLPDDLHDRAIVIEMRRKLATDTVAPFREDRVENLTNLARRCACVCRKARFEHIGDATHRPWPAT